MKESLPNKKLGLENLKKTIRNAGIASLFSLSTFVGSGQTKENRNLDQDKATTEFAQYFDSLNHKNPESVTADEMDIFLNKLLQTYNLIPNKDSFEIEKRKFLKKIYDKHSPYSLEKKKVQIQDLIPGYDLNFGADKEDRIILNRILTEVGFDFSKLSNQNLQSENLEGYGNVVSTYDINTQKDFGNKRVSIHITDNSDGLSASAWVKIINTDNNKNIANFILASSNNSEKIDHEKFLTELNTILNQQIKL